VGALKILTCITFLSNFHCLSKCSSLWVFDGH